MDYKKILEGVVDIINTAEKSDIGFANICTYIGENCPELKESKDEKIRKALIRFHKSTIDVDGIKGDDIIAWLENIPYTIDHEKREGFHLGYKAGLEKQGEQKPQRMISAEAKEAMYDKPAWGEEDESLRLRTIGALETCKIGSPTKCVDEQINWLKSLKDRYTWKPSKEQMEALEHFIVYHNGSTNYAKDLEELRLQLKKLREE